MMEGFLTSGSKNRMKKPLDNDKDMSRVLGVDPFMKADSLVLMGSCKAVVCCVGENSSRDQQDSGLETPGNTALQVKLQNLSD